MVQRPVRIVGQSIPPKPTSPFLDIWHKRRNHVRSLPKINAVYWITLCAASIFGTNTGDYVSDAMGIGHLAGLPWLLVVFLLLIGADLVAEFSAPLLFWAAIITVRTAATNFGDAFHDFHIGFEISLPIVLVLFAVSVLWYRRSCVSLMKNLPTGGVYWLTMTLAGIVGTIGGDAASFRLRLMPLGTAALFFLLAGVVIAASKRKGGWTNPLIYWLALVLIRTAGTGAGDALAHAAGLPFATLLSGGVFVGLVIWFYAVIGTNVRTDPELVVEAERG
ncbi:putative membrane-anchored protein [Rhizobium sp. BK376]|nr:putative membrane-anchored protein [Rhizobium sp. BK376]